MRLAAVLHVELRLGMALAYVRQHAVENRRVRARQEREDTAWLREQPVDDGRRDIVEARARGDGAVPDEAEIVARSNGEAVHLRIA